ncbi:hypothetical protein BSKO_10002 [Bryopsis sp. KO-2023]|nr:hypothetical protein BSKO_10002 [Bryopsis sp. KO-2023]
MIRDSRYEYSRGGRRSGYERQRYGSRSVRGEEYVNGSKNRAAATPSSNGASLRPGMPSFLKDEASKLLRRKKQLEEAEKKDQELLEEQHQSLKGPAKRTASLSDSDVDEHVSKRHRSSPRKLSSEKSTGRKRRASGRSPRDPQPSEAAFLPKKITFNPYHEGASEEDEPQGSEEMGRVMAMRKSKWEVEEEPEAEPAVDSKANANSGAGPDPEGCLVSDEEEEYTSLQNTTQGIDMRQAARIVDEYSYVNKISEGAYGIVFRGREKCTGKQVALKKIKMEKEKDGYPLTSLREINILASLNHPNIVNVSEVVVSASGNSVFLVMEYLEHDLKRVSELLRHRFTVSDSKCIMHQLLSGVAYLHDNWIIHRDLKLSNILYNNKGDVKICDFGLARQYGSPLHPYTQLVVTLWYRAPELLLGTNIYSTGIDMWAMGCIMGELLRGKPMFDKNNEIAQIDRIFEIVGSPTDENWPGFRKLPNVPKMKINDYKPKLHEWFPKTSFTGGPMLTENGFDLLNKMLCLDPKQRISAKDALNHPWFEERPRACLKTMLPTFG